MIFATPNRGTGGAGAQGILQGMIAGQQSRESDQKMQWLQTQQDRQTEQYETGEFMGYIKNIADVQENGGNALKQVDAINKFKANSVNYNDGDNFRLRNINNFKNEDGSFTNEFINNYKDNTGKDWIEGSASAGNYVDEFGNQVMLGDKVFDPDTFKAGSSNYRDYSDNLDMVRDLKQAQIDKARGGKDAKEKVTEMDYIGLKTKANKEGYSSLTDTEKSAYDLGSEKFKMTKRDSRNALFSPESDAISDHISKDGSPDTYDRDTENYYLNAESANGVKLANKQKIKDNISQVRNINGLVQDWDNLSSDEVASGIVDNQTVDLVKKVNTEEFKTLKPEEQRKVLKTIGLRSKTGMFGKKFVNAISGTAVSDDEFKTIMDILTGGPLTQNGVESIKAALGGASAGLSDSALADVKSIGKENVGSKMELRRMLREANSPYVPKVTKGGTKTMEEVAGGSIGRQTEDAVEKTKDIGEAIIDALTGGDGDKKEEPLKAKIQPELPPSKDRKFFQEFSTIKELKEKLPKMSKEAQAYYKANERQIMREYLINIGDR